MNKDPDVPSVRDGGHEGPNNDEFEATVTMVQVESQVLIAPR